MLVVRRNDDLGSVVGNVIAVFRDLSRELDRQKLRVLTLGQHLLTFYDVVAGVDAPVVGQDHQVYAARRHVAQLLGKEGAHAGAVRVQSRELEQVPVGVPRFGVVDQDLARRREGGALNLDALRKRHRIDLVSADRGI
jgi:hypothetical protein